MTEPLRILDTSVIVRYLANDVPHLAERARRLIDSDLPLGITSVALLEAAYALGRPPYAYPREAIVESLVELIQRRNIRGVGIDTAHAAVALMLCRSSTSVSFGDALMAATGLSEGVTEAYSFDARFGRSGLRVVPVPEATGPG